MKVSVLTPTYNRESLLKKLYTSLIENSNYGVDIEWLIMDDGSTDHTKEVVEEFKKDNKIEIKYYRQDNQGKMVAINHLVTYATGELIIDCDSDDYFTKDAFLVIRQAYQLYKKEEDSYGMCFLKYDQNGKNMGNLFKNEKTTMFDLYFKEEETGEKAIVFFSDVRKQYKHELEQGEKFVTEARMYHQMDLKYKMICLNKPIMICEYQEKGYTKNIEKQFQENPYGYYQYFKEILQRDMQHVNLKKRLYTIKHYILFVTLTNARNNVRQIKNMANKIMYFILYIPGKLKTKMKFKNE